jgi:hypothetical protein
MIVIKSTAEYAATVRRIANTMPIHRIADITDLHEAAGILEDLAKKKRAPADPALNDAPVNLYSDRCTVGPFKLLEDEV